MMLDDTQKCRLWTSYASKWVFSGAGRKVEVMQSERRRCTGKMPPRLVRSCEGPMEFMASRLANFFVSISYQTESVALITFDYIEAELCEPSIKRWMPMTTVSYSTESAHRESQGGVIT